MQSLSPKWTTWAAVFLAILTLAGGLWYAQHHGWMAHALAWVKHPIPSHETNQGGMGMNMGSRGGHPAEASGMPGLAVVQIAPELQQRLGVTTAEVRKEPLRMSVRTVGIVRPNEKRLARVHLRTEGWIRDLFINFTGENVEKGQKLLSIYSPQFVTTQQEYLNALQADDKSLAELARKRLELWDVPDEEINELRRAGKPKTYLTLRSPIAGTVLTKNAFEDQYVTPKAELYTVADLTTIEGRERYPVNVRYARSYRSDLDRLRRVLVGTPTGAQVPMQELADVRLVSGPNMIKSEAAQLVGYVYIDFRGRDTGGYVRDLRQMVEQMVHVPPGYHLEWSGAYQAMQRANQRLVYVIPVTLLVIFVLLYLNTRSLAKVLIVLLAVPFSLVGAFLLLSLLGYHLSVAVWVGIIALAGVDAETGVVMLLYLDVAHERRLREGQMNSLEDLEAGVLEGAVERVRPKMMTVMAILMGLLPIMWSSGTGSDVMKRIAAPMVGGVITSFLLELLIYPAIYTIWKWWAEVRPALRSSSTVSAGGGTG